MTDSCPRGACRPPPPPTFVRGAAGRSSLDREWAWGGSTGAGVRVCVVDSGIEADHPLVGGVTRAVAIERRRRRRRQRHGGRGGRPLRARHGVRGRHPLARAGLRAPQRAGARRGLHRQRPGAPGGPALGAEGGLRRHQHEPLDDEEPVRGHAARPGRQRLLQALPDRRLRAQHARGELPLALLLRDLRRQPRRAPTRCATTGTRRRRSRSSRTASTSRWPGSAASASARPATASRRRTSPPSRR